MTTTNQTVSLINPWSKARVERDVASIAANIQAYPWPGNVCEALDGRYDSDAEWVVAAVEMMGAELAGVVIIGS